MKSRVIDDVGQNEIEILAARADSNNSNNIVNNSTELSHYNPLKAAQVKIVCATFRNDPY